MSNHVGLDHVSCHNLCSGIVSNHSLLQFGFVIEHLEFAFLVTTASHVILLVAFVTQAIIASQTIHRANLGQPACGSTALLFSVLIPMPRPV